MTIEAFLAAKPVITATDSGGPLEFVRDGVNGFICEPDAMADGGRHQQARLRSMRWRNVSAVRAARLRRRSRGTASSSSSLADPSSVSIVIPAMNEADAIGAVVSRLRGAASWREIIVVDDGSMDDTAERAREAGACVIRHPYNKGNGAAVKTGIRRASGDFVLIIDADGQHPPEDAQRLAARLGEFDLVIGARATATQATAARRAGNALLNSLASYLTGRPIPDLTSGFRGARTECLREFIHCCRTDSRRRRRPRSRSSKPATTSPSSRSTRGSARPLEDPLRAGRRAILADPAEDRHALQSAAHLPAASARASFAVGVDLRHLEHDRRTGRFPTAP